MKSTQGLAALVLLATTTAAHAEFSGTVTATTDYDWRGVTQTAQDPALQGSLDYATDFGLYAGAWASNVDFGSGDPNVEIDFYVGWGGGETLLWDVGAIYYVYPGESDFNFPEIYGSLGWEFIEGKISYSWDFAGTSETAFYYEANVDYGLPANFGVIGHIGYSDGDGITAAYSNYDVNGNIVESVDNYMDWAVGITYTWGHFDLALKWVDGEDLETKRDTVDDISSSEARAIFSVSTTFPWSKDE
jgi:uncharacterized protein (TIGR02001 family)